MKIQIIKGRVESDQTVTKDDAAVFGVDFSGIASDFWALEWDSETEIGEIEWATGPVANQPVTSEAEIDSALGGVTLQTMLTRRQAIIDAAEATDEAADEAAEAAAEAADTREEWDKNRQLEYPNIGELVVALYDTEDKAALDAKRAAVKTKWPKDDSGPIE
jgi:hypothetical protein